MLKKLLKKMNVLKIKRTYDSKEEEEKKRENKKERIPKSLAMIEKKLKKVFCDCSDLVMREIILGHNLKILVVFLDGLAEKDMINNSVIRPILHKSRLTLKDEINSSDVIKSLKEEVIDIGNVKETEDFKQSIDAILNGETLLFIENINKALKVGTQGFKGRSVEEAASDKVIRGPREAFVEQATINMTLLRRKIKNSRLKFEKIQLGEQTHTDVYISYIKGIVHDDIVNTVRRRLGKIKTDAILDSGYLEEFIEDAPFSIFPTIGTSEKPDIIAANMLEGRVAIICDGTPFVLSVPYLFAESIQSSTDYYSRWYFASLVRLFTILGFAFSVTLPAFYVALVSFHQDVIPIRLLLTMAATQEGIPFSPFTEALFMGLVFEILVEAGIRMPKPIGQAISIVGALVLGDAVVKAGLISSPMIIITAITAISSFLVPDMRGLMPFLRLAFLVAANILGFMGMMLMAIFVLIHLCGLRSFGVSYLSPLTPLNGMDLKDTIFRAPLWMMLTRPQGIIRDNADRSKLRMNINFIKRED